MITLQLEQKLTKEQIFEMYCNQVDLGHRGSFTIRGFGEAAQAYFGKDIKSSPWPKRPRWRPWCAARAITTLIAIRTACESAATPSSR